MKQSFFQGAVILMIGSAVSRILGFVYRIYVVRLLGPEGIGLYEMVFPLITLILVLTTAGIPVALAKLVADDYAVNDGNSVVSILRIAMLILAATGILFPSVLMYAAPWLIPKFFADSRAYWPFIHLIPALFFVSISSVLRGYFQGINFMVPLASGQLFEQVTRIVVGICLVSWLLPYGVEFGAAGLSLAVVAGEATGLIVLVLYYWRSHVSIQKNSQKVSETSMESKTIVSRLVSLAAPVTMSRIVASLMLSAKAIIIPNRLQVAGFTLEQATQFYGMFSGMAMSLVSFPTVITGSLSSVLLPVTASAVARKEFRQVELRVNQAVKFTVLTALPFTVWFTLLAEPLMLGFFNSREAAVPLRLLAAGCVFFYLQQTTSGMLYGLGKMNTMLFNSLTGNLISLITTYVFTGMPSLGIKGAALGALIGGVVTCVLNLYTLLKSTPVNLSLTEWIFKGILASLIMIIFVSLTAGKISLLVSLTVSGSSYLVTLFITGGLKLAEFRNR